MDRHELALRLRDEVLVLDGSYGAELMRRGHLAEGPPEALNLSSPRAVGDLHAEYVEAGADMVLTNTFGATPSKLRAAGLPPVDEVVGAAVRNAREAVRGRALVVGDIGPTGVLPYPLGEATFDWFLGEYRPVASALAGAGVDAIILETFSDLQELKAATFAVREASRDAFLIACMTFDRTGRTLTGTDPLNFALTLDDLDVDALGINCSLGPVEMAPLLRELAGATPKPVVAEPNAGLPVLEGGRTVYPVGPEEFARHAEDLLDAGAGIVGGCCGTGIEHIRRLRRLVGSRRPAQRTVARRAGVSCPQRAVLFDHFVPIGERLNPANRKALRAHMEAGELLPLVAEARRQVEAGAEVLDVNFGLESSVARETMERLVLSIAYGVGVPVALDVQSPEVLERLMRVYPGRPLVNSSTAEPSALEAKLGALGRNGGMLVVLCMTSDVPCTLGDRVAAMEGALATMGRSGFDPSRALLDPVVLPVGAGNDPSGALAAIERIHARGLLGVVGLSNVSFGLPDRGALNAAFLAQAVARGLDSAILNPQDEIVWKVLNAALVLDRRKALPRPQLEGEDQVLRLLLDGDGKGMDALLRGRAAERGAIAAIEEVLRPAMERIGELYAQGRLYLPQLILAAQTAVPALEALERTLPRSAPGRRLVIATVQGDIHDIGKNVVAAVLRGSGYGVVDLGKDVSAERIVAAVREASPLALGLSSMLTTTAPRIAEVVAMLRGAGLDVPVIAGGASLDERAVRELGADLYARDAMDAVRFLGGLKGQKG